MTETSLTVAVIDPSRVRAAILEEGLRAAGVGTVVVVADGPDLQARVAALKPDVVVVHLESPSRDILEQMSGIARHVERPVAMFVDRSDATMMQAAVDAGISAYVVDGLRTERIRSILDIAILRFNAFARLQRELLEARSELADRKVIDRAKGILMSRKGFSEEESYRLLRKQAMNEKRKIIDIARAIVTAADLLGMRVDLGYVPLTDAAPVLAAAELGFAQEEGIDLVLTPEPSWATLRDRLALGHLDAAHMLAPLALATRLGLSGPQADSVAPMALNLNGNAIALSLPLWTAMAPETDDLDTVAAAFARVARERAGRGRPLTLATVHPFSSHSYQLRIFAARGGLDLAQAVRIVVVPPPQTVAALASGEIDGVCVGAPWTSIAVAAGLGRIAALGCAIVPDCPEKVLALHASQSEALAPLIEAVQRAGIWCADPANVGELAELLSEKGGLGPDTDLIRRSLTGHLVMDSAGLRHTDPDYLRLGAEVHRPRPGHGLWLAEQMAASGQIADGTDIAAAVKAFYRPDLLKA